MARMGWVWVLGLAVACDGGGDTDPADTDPVDTPVDSEESPPDTPSETEDTPEESPAETLIDSDTPVVETEDTPADTPIDTDLDTPVDTDLDTPEDTPEDTPIDTPVDTPVDSDPPVETGADTGLETGLGDETGLDTDAGPAPTPIQDVRQGLVPLGSTATLRGVSVLATHPEGLWVAEASGAPGSGVFVRLDPGEPQTFYGLAKVNVVGLVTEEPSGAGARLVIDTRGALGEATLLVPGPQPPRVPLALADFADPAALEPWEGMLVRVDGVRIWEAVTNRDYLLGEDGPVLYLSGDLAFVGSLVYGDRIDTLTGVLDWVDGQWTLFPRNAGDVGVATVLANPADTIQPGELILTEWFKSPTTPGCTVANGSFVEILNTTPAALDLDGLYVYDLLNDIFAQVRGPHEVGPGERAVIWSAGEANCYGLPTDYPDGAPWGAGGWLSLFNQVEALDYAPVALWPRAQNGASLEVVSGALDAVGNDDANNWCVATAPFAGNDLGTPGGAASCP